MKIIFYGTRGSIPVSGQQYKEFGGNTACVCVEFDNGDIMIIDCGSGIRNLGNELIANKHEQYENIYIGMTHTHWDHIQGFPFFKPAYDSRRKFTFSPVLVHRHLRSLESVFAGQMQNEYFPIPMSKMGAQFYFPESKRTYMRMDNFEVFVNEHNHPGGALGIKIIADEKTFVFCTDVEHEDGIDQNVVEFCKGADLLVHDAQFTPEELKSKHGWGHSSYAQACDVATQANVNNLALFHHDPEHTDNMLLDMEGESQKLFPNTFCARDYQSFQL
ncbi:MAG: MBL fold metallo-hydrolase [Melioribacteraceae bacterium]|nr:MBL fold metallo-hydrolase [Melioribacteraceae bacterium]